MKNGFRKLLATLCTLALLLTSFTAVLADNEIEQEQPEEQVELLTPETQPEESAAEEQPEAGEGSGLKAESVQKDESETKEESEPTTESEQKEKPESEDNETPEEAEAKAEPEVNEESRAEDKSGTKEEPKAEEESNSTTETEENQLPDADLPSEPGKEEIKPENEDNEVVSESVQIETELNLTEDEEEEQPTDPEPDVIQEEIPEENQNDNVEEKPNEEKNEEKEQPTEQTEEPEESGQTEESEKPKEPGHTEEPEKLEESKELETPDQTAEIEEQVKTEEQEELETLEEQDQPGKIEQLEESEQNEDPEQLEDFDETEEAVSDLNILHLGKKGIEGSLKAGEEYTINYTSKYSYNIILTLTLKQQNIGDNPLPVSKNGKGIGLKVFFDDREKELIWVENEDSESTDVIYTFITYAEKNQEYAIRIISQFDADFTLSAVQMIKEEALEEEKEVVETSVCPEENDENEEETSTDLPNNLVDKIEDNSNIEDATPEKTDDVLKEKSKDESLLAFETDIDESFEEQNDLTGEMVGEQSAIDNKTDELETTVENESDLTDDPAIMEDIPSDNKIINEEDVTVSFIVLWDVENPTIGDTAHFKAVIDGIEDTDYRIQWQMSEDNQNWTDLDGEIHEQMDLVVTEENITLYWRVTIYFNE